MKSLQLHLLHFYPQGKYVFIVSHDMFIFRARGEIDQLSTNTFKYSASVYIAAQQYLHYFNGGPLVPLISEAFVIKIAA